MCDASHGKHFSHGEGDVVYLPVTNILYIVRTCFKCLISFSLFSSTRSSVLISVLLWSHSSGLLNIPMTREALLVAIFLYMAFFQLLALVDSVKDPYTVIQDPICYVLFTLPAEIFSDVKGKSKTE